MNAQAHESKSNYTAVHLLLRLFLSQRILLVGTDRIEAGGECSFDNYNNNMAGMVSGITGASFMPL